MLSAEASVTENKSFIKFVPKMDLEVAPEDWESPPGAKAIKTFLSASPLR